MLEKVGRRTSPVNEIRNVRKYRSGLSSMPELYVGAQLAAVRQSIART